MSIRVHQLAKELGISSKELIDKLIGLKIEVKGHMSSLDDNTVILVKGELKPKPKKTEDKKRKKPIEVKKLITETKDKEESLEEKPSLKIDEIPKKVLRLDFPVVVKELALKLQIKPNELIKRLLDKRIVVTISQTLDEEIVNSVCGEFCYLVEKSLTLEENLLAEFEKVNPERLNLRAPIVTFMGHVDHGKTSLLDMIRKTKVVDEEAGGITQHIGAYEVKLPKGSVTLLDTPGHSAFTAMRARGAKVTDVVVLVVAADDGVMPQTIEAIDHAKAANVPIVVAINKIDKPHISLDKVKNQLSELSLTPEDWGGKTITVSVSAKTGQGIDELLEMLLLEAELLELKADPTAPAGGVVIDAELSKGKGPVATLLVLNGTIRLGDMVLVGVNCGKVKAMFDYKGHNIIEAGPSKPVEILGLSGVPYAGERFYAINDDKRIKDIVSARRLDAEKKKMGVRNSKVSLEDLYNKIKKGETKELKIILKADVDGSMEALKDSLGKLSTEQVKLSVIHAQVGGINESDIILASASEAVVLGLHIDINPNAKALAKQEGVEVRRYSIIYEVIEDVRAAMEGMLEPIVEEIFIGRAEVREVFKVSKSGIVAGCIVLKGRIPRDAVCKILRDKKVVFKGKINSLKHFKDDIKEAKEGTECGISFGTSDLSKGDIVEAVEIKKVARKLE